MLCFDSHLVLRVFYALSIFFHVKIMRICDVSEVTNVAVFVNSDPSLLFASLVFCSRRNFLCIHDQHILPERWVLIQFSARECFHNFLFWYHCYSHCLQHYYSSRVKSSLLWLFSNGIIFFPIKDLGKHLHICVYASFGL